MPVGLKGISMKDSQYLAKVIFFSKMVKEIR